MKINENIIEISNNWFAVIMDDNTVLLNLKNKYIVAEYKNNKIVKSSNRSYKTATRFISYNKKKNNFIKNVIFIDDIFDKIVYSQLKNGILV